jgi:nucleotide-binding universal stress UspA family protein
MMTRQLHLLVAVDGSAPSLQAARLAIKTAREMDGIVRIVTVMVDRTTHELLDTAGSGGTPARDRAAAGFRDVASYLEELGARTGVTVDCTHLEIDGPPYEAILGLAGEWEADFIFIGRTSRTGPGRALLGSQTEHVLEFAEVPVVVVPG